MIWCNDGMLRSMGLGPIDQKKFASPIIVCRLRSPFNPMPYSLPSSTRGETSTWPLHSPIDHHCHALQRKNLSYFSFSIHGHTWMRLCYFISILTCFFFYAISFSRVRCLINNRPAGKLHFRSEKALEIWHIIFIIYI